LLIKLPFALHLQICEDSGEGLDLLARTIASYATLSPLPTTDDAKMQTWVIQQSTVLSYNLAPYFKGWGWPVSTATEAALAYLPSWPPTSNNNMTASVPFMTSKKVGKDRTANATMLVVESNGGAPIASASVSGRWLFYPSTKPTVPSLNTTWGPLLTSSSGYVSSTSPIVKVAGTFTVIVTDVSATGYSWDQAQATRSVTVS
jgi:hypothetical protein